MNGLLTLPSRIHSALTTFHARIDQKMIESGLPVDVVTTNLKGIQSQDEQRQVGLDLLLAQLIRHSQPTTQDEQQLKQHYFAQLKEVTANQVTEDQINNAVGYSRKESYSTKDDIAWTSSVFETPANTTTKHSFSLTGYLGNRQTAGSSFVELYIVDNSSNQSNTSTLICRLEGITFANMRDHLSSLDQIPLSQ